MPIRIRLISCDCFGSAFSGAKSTPVVLAISATTASDAEAGTRKSPARTPSPAAAARFADGWEAVLARSARVVFVVTHEIPLRYLLNGAGGSDELDGPVHELRNAAPYLFAEADVRRGIGGIRQVLAAR